MAGIIDMTSGSDRTGGEVRDGLKRRKRAAEKSRSFFLSRRHPSGAGFRGTVWMLRSQGEIFRTINLTVDPAR